MRKPVTFLITFLTALAAAAQITTTKVAPVSMTIEKVAYDSLKNFLGEKPSGYLGQELYLPGMADILRQYGYEHFVLDYTKPTLANRDNVYKCCDGFNSKYADLAGKYFTVVDITRHPDASKNALLYGKKYYFKLVEKESKDTVYYEYDGEYESSFPFITVGYFMKLKPRHLGEQYVVRGKTGTRLQSL